MNPLDPTSPGVEAPQIPEAGQVGEVTRHFTATTFVVHDGRVLLHLHPKQRIWLPPGGHIERDELPDDAARREIEEETGLRLRLHSEAASSEDARRMECGVVAQPAFILIEDINPFHQHIDFTYFAWYSRETEPSEGKRLSGPEDTPEEYPAPPAVPTGTSQALAERGFRWFRLDELEMEGVPPNVREGARRAVAYFESSTELGTMRR